MVKALRIYGQDSDTGISEGTLIQNIDVIHDDLDDGDDDEVLTLRQFPESFEEFEELQLPNHGSCSKPINDGIRRLDGDKDTHYGCLVPELMRMQRILSSLKMGNPTYCNVLIYVIKESLNRRFERFYELEELKAKDGMIASVSFPFFKMKWVPKANREYIKEVFVSEMRKIKQEDEKCSQVQHTDSDKKKEKTESYYMFVEDSDSSAASDNVNTTTIDLETLEL
ncbi:hypothetical protein HHI36_002983 [Cryptolaemus montrouzieri]|uniref:Uncharacterized protein n=1 Tax=Cryptolaemus montrouzieri TaxID=559131 RepID=A0ABD2PC42_9CUCU